MTPAQRQFWAERLHSQALCYAVGFASHTEIDVCGIVPATRLAMQRALSQLSVSPQHLLLDFLDLPDLPIPQTCLVKGDRRSLSIAAASVLAKTARDELMCRLDLQYPGYGFAVHKGYGTWRIAGRSWRSVQARSTVKVSISKPIPPPEYIRRCQTDQK